jgi:hypothetical protein
MSEVDSNNVPQSPEKDSIAPHASGGGFMGLLFRTSDHRLMQLGMGAVALFELLRLWIGLSSILQLPLFIGTSYLLTSKYGVKSTDGYLFYGVAWVAALLLNFMIPFLSHESSFGMTVFAFIWFLAYAIATEATVKSLTGGNTDNETNHSSSVGTGADGSAS